MIRIILICIIVTSCTIMHIWNSPNSKIEVYDSSQADVGAPSLEFKENKEEEEDSNAGYTKEEGRQVPSSGTSNWSVSP